MQVRIVGSGLIGTSIGLGARAHGSQVEMVDSDQENMRLARDLVGGERVVTPDIVIFALPTSGLGLVAEREFLLNPNSIFMDVGSVKTKPQQEIDAIPGMASVFCGTHPMAGREMGGPEAARADLFEGRPWILCPSDKITGASLSMIEEFVTSLGGSALKMTALEHDKTVAMLSHLPQIVSSLLASQLTGMQSERLALAGQGLRDTTRIAHSDPLLWREIISLNAAEILPLLRKFQNDIADLVATFDRPEALENFLRRGNEGVAGIPGKHGGRARDYYYLPIVIDDKPGQLAALFDECAKVSVNVEDLTIEHSPGQFTGLISLALSQIDGERLSAHLLENGWKVHALR